MSAISEVGRIQKLKTEVLLSEIVDKYPDIEIGVGRVRNTPIKKSGELIMDIYYRKHEIRINIKLNSPQTSVYEDLLRQGVVYQKDTANPRSTESKFAFFVNEANTAYAVKKLLNL